MSAPDPYERPAAQRIDPLALTRHLRRLATLPEPPWLHGEVAQRMLERLALIKLQPQRVLSWSAFLGASEPGLRLSYPAASFAAVEPIEALRQRSQQIGAAGRSGPSGWWGGLRRQSSAAVPPAAVQLPLQVAEAQADLLWANMYLHLSPDPAALLRLWQRALAVDGFLMFSSIGPDSLRELRALFAALDWGVAGPEWTDMHDVGDMLVGAGFADPVMDQERITLSWAEPAKLLADLRLLGGNLAPQRFAGCRSRAWRGRLLQALEGLRAANGRLQLTLELVYGHAIKPKPRPALNPETRVSLDEMRQMVRRPSRP